MPQQMHQFHEMPTRLNSGSKLIPDQSDPFSPFPHFSMDWNTHKLVTSVKTKTKTKTRFSLRSILILACCERTISRNEHFAMNMTKLLQYRQYLLFKEPFYHSIYVIVAKRKTLAKKILFTFS